MNKRNEDCLILGINPNKWYGEGELKNCKVNKKLKNLDIDKSWIGNFDSKKIFKGMKGIIKIGHDKERGAYCKKHEQLARGIYATFEVIKFNKDENRVYFKVLDNFYAQNEIVSEGTAIRILTENKFNLSQKSADVISLKEFTEIREAFLKNIFKDKPITKRKKSKKQRVTVYCRDEQIRSLALGYANHLCELDNKHKSFITKNNQNYMESHHLIPLNAYNTGEFDNDELDRVANIVSLCPNCHRKIHYGNNYDIGEMLSILFKARENRLNNADIKITLDELKELYRIKN